MMENQLQKIGSASCFSKNRIRHREVEHERKGKYKAFLRKIKLSRKEFVIFPNEQELRFSISLTNQDL
jgi:hypothetical protein